MNILISILTGCFICTVLLVLAPPAPAQEDVDGQLLFSIFAGILAGLISYFLLEQ
jgi:Na+-translocating ferredoxin:NAD+ oxidoreductase RnfD subunit